MDDSPAAAVPKTRQWLALLCSGFIAGIAAYTTILRIADLEVVRRGSCIPKNELSLPILRNEFLRELDHLIETGSALRTDEERTVWSMNALAFVQVVAFQKDANWQGQRVSAFEADIRYAQTDPSIAVQTQKVLGVLKGLRAGFETRVP